MYAAFRTVLAAWALCFAPVQQATAGEIIIVKITDLAFSPATVKARVGDTVVIGPAMLVGTRVNKANPKADVMAFDVRTGRKRWTLHTVPRRGEPGYETWENGSADYTGNAGMWGPFSADSQLGLVYLPIETPTNDVYGGHRPGDNLYGNTLVAVEARTGKKVWHQQKPPMISFPSRTPVWWYQGPRLSSRMASTPSRSSARRSSLSLRTPDGIRGARCSRSRGASCSGW